LEKLRVALGKELSKIGDGLADLFVGLRKSAQEIFLEHGHLKNFLPETENPLEWWNTFAFYMESLPAQGAKDIADAIRRFKDASLSYEQLLEPRIMLHGCLNSLDRGLKEGKHYDHQPNDTPEIIHPKLFNAVGEALQKICALLEKPGQDGTPSILVEPSASLFSAIEKFYLVGFFDEPSKKTWERFYTNYCDEIWASNGTVPPKLVKEWNTEVNSLLNLCKSTSADKSST
jgi:hypothetical protein